MPNQVALITGASKGIGLELAKCFAGGGFDVVLLARDQGELETLAENIGKTFPAVVAHVVAVDLSRQDACDQIQQALLSRAVTVDVLVNNAGFGLLGKFEEADLQTQMDMLQVNVVALTKLSRLLLPGMVARKRGGILNVASVAGFFPGPLMAVYYATKAYVISLSEALANEVKGSGVTISCLCPGATDTHFQKRAKVAGSKLFTMNLVMTAEAVAKEGYSGFKRGQTVVITGASNHFAALASKVIPRSIGARIARSMAEQS